MHTNMALDPASIATIAEACVWNDRMAMIFIAFQIFIYKNVFGFNGIKIYFIFI